MAIGYIALGIMAFLLAVKYFAVLPGEIKDWNYMFRPAPQAPSEQKDQKGEPDGPHLYRPGNSHRRPPAH